MISNAISDGRGAVKERFQFKATTMRLEHFTETAREPIGFATHTGDADVFQGVSEQER